MSYFCWSIDDFSSILPVLSSWWVAVFLKNFKYQVTYYDLLHFHTTSHMQVDLTWSCQCDQIWHKFCPFGEFLNLLRDLLILLNFGQNCKPLVISYSTTWANVHMNENSVSTSRHTLRGIQLSLFSSDLTKPN